MPGLPTLLGKLYQLQFLLFGDFEFLTNNDYLELRDKSMYSLMYIPMMFLYYNFHTVFLVMIPWGCISAIYVLVGFITTSVNAAAISLSDEEHNM